MVDTDVATTTLTADELADQLARLPISPDSYADDALDTAIAHLRRLRQQTEALQADDDLRERVAERLRAYEARRDRLNRLSQVRQEVESRLARAQSMFEGGATVQAVADSYRNTASFVRGVVDETDWELPEREILLTLSGHVERTRQRFLNDHEQPTTRQQGEELADLVYSLSEQARKDPHYRVTYFTEPRFGAPMAVVPVSEALRTARNILFKLWADKIAEYLETARQRLEIDHQPQEAYGQWEQCLRLPGRDSPEIGVSLSEDLLATIESMRVRIEAARAARRAAEQALTRADNALAPPHPDALLAERYRSEAETHDPYTPGLAERRGHILDAAAAEIPTLLTAAEDALRDEAWPQVAAGLDRAAKLLDLAPAAEQLPERARLNTARAIYDAVRPLTEPSSQLTLTEQRELLDQLALSRADDYWPAWAGLARRRDRLHTLGRIDSLIQQVDAACQPNGQAADLEEVAAALATLQASPPADAPPEKLARLPDMRRRVDAWLGFARARDELAKVPKAGTPLTVVPDELDSDAIADLHVVAQGLAAAEKNIDARRASEQRTPTMRQQLDRLTRNDETAKTLLSVALGLLAASRYNADDLQRQMDALKTNLGRPSSHRQELFAAYHELRQRLLLLRRRELERALDDERPSHYAKLAEDHLRRQLDGVKGLWSGAEDDPDYLALAAEVALARALARAHRIQARVPLGLNTWAEVKQAWETARDKAPDASEAFDFAHRQSRLAHKQDVFEKAAGVDSPEKAADLLAALTNDISLRDDWEVFYRHGRAVFALARQAVTPNQAFSQNVELLDGAREAAESARRSLLRAEALVTGRTTADPAEAEARGQLRGLVAAMDGWDVLLRAVTQYREALGSEWPDNARCLQMLQTHEATVKRLSRGQPAAPGLPDASRWYGDLWLQTRAVAQGRLNKRLSDLPANAILERLDALLGLAILFPEGDVSKQLADQALQILSDLQGLVTNTVGDYGGAAFRQRLSVAQQQQNDDNFLIWQIEEARRTALTMEQYGVTLRQIGADGLRIDLQFLADQTEQVKRWVTEMERFRDALETALGLAEDGLANPRQFDKAQRILHQAQTPYPDLVQVAPEFSNANHPAYRLTKEKVNADMQRRQKQENYLAQIKTLIAREQQAVALALRWRSGDPLSEADKDQVRQLITHVSQLRSLLREFINDAPADPTLLQEELSYALAEAPHDPNRVVHGASSIEKLCAAKVEQYKAVNLWLSNWVDGDGLRNVVDWGQTRAQLARWRDSGPQGLQNARQGCIEAREGDGAGRCAGQWALRPAYQALAEAALDTLTARTQANDEPMWYGLIEPLNQRRLALRRQLAQAIAENEQLEADVRRRISQYQARLDQLKEKQLALLSAHRPPWRQWIDMPVWSEFRKAAEAFCQICPRDPIFRTISEEVAEVTGVTFYCSGEEGAAGS